MVIFQNLVIQEKEVFLKKINKYLIFFIVGASLLSPKKAFPTESTNQKILNYFQDIKFFSSNFYQNNSETIEEGRFFLNKERNRLRIQYLKPTKIL